MYVYIYSYSIYHVLYIYTEILYYMLSSINIYIYILRKFIKLLYPIYIYIILFFFQTQTPRPQRIQICGSLVTKKLQVSSPELHKDLVYARQKTTHMWDHMGILCADYIYIYILWLLYTMVIMENILCLFYVIKYKYIYIYKYYGNQNKIYCILIIYDNLPVY